MGVETEMVVPSARAPRGEDDEADDVEAPRVAPPRADDDDDENSEGKDGVRKKQRRADGDAKRDEPDDPDRAVEECRFCFEEGTPDDPLIVSCKCSGTIGKVHKSCLRKWILEKRHLSCEICDEVFRIDSSILSAQEVLAYRTSRSMHHRLSGIDASGDLHRSGQHRRMLRGFLVRHERVSRWINACILSVFSVIMLLVIVFLIYNWNTYYRNRDSVVLVNEIAPRTGDIHLFTGFCDMKRRMTCVVNQATIENSTSLQARVCEGSPEGTPCLRLSKLKFQDTCRKESEPCSVRLMEGEADGVCNARGQCRRSYTESIFFGEASSPRNDTAPRVLYDEQLLHGTCACSP